MPFHCAKAPALLVLAFLLNACALHSEHAVAEPPAEEAGQPATERAGREDSVRDLALQGLDSYIARMRELASAARPSRVKTMLPTVEATNARLALALTALTVIPTAERHIEVAHAYREAGILDKAHEHLTLAAEMRPASAGAYDGLARIWRDWGFPNVALPDAYRATYYAPASPEAQNTLGTVLQALGSQSQARRHYRRALELNPRAAYALNNLCTLDLAEGQPAAAVMRCEEAVHLAPDLAVAVRNLEHARAALRAAPGGNADARH